MATISSLGVGSGLDSEGIINALMSVERRPVSLLVQQTTGIKTQLSSIGQLQSLAATMRDKAAAISSVSLWGQTALTSSDPTSVTGSSSSSSAIGRYAVKVSALAASQTSTSAAFATSDSTLNEGSLTIELGAWAGTAFTAKAGSSPVSITVGAGETSLASIRDKINAAGAGVTASIINDANGARLSLRSTATGEVNGFRITATETVDDSNVATGLSALGVDGTPTSPMGLDQPAGNARAEINGIDIVSATNTLTNVADGLNLTLGKVTTAAIEVVVASDTAAVKTAITDFVTAFNALATYIRDQTKYNEESKTGAPLQGNRTVIGFQWQLRGVINQGSTASSTWSNLSEVGIEMKADGTLGISTSDLDDALENPDELRKLLATDAADTTSSGFMDRFKDLGNSVLDTTTGSLETLEQSLQARVERNDDRQSQMEDRLVSTEARIRAQYQALDTSMARLNALSNYVTQQMAALSNNS
jgi:flagellar hook-associated protein 2